MESEVRVPDCGPRRRRRARRRFLSASGIVLSVLFVLALGCCGRSPAAGVLAEAPMEGVPGDEMAGDPSGEDASEETPAGEDPPEEDLPGDGPPEEEPPGGAGSGGGGGGGGRPRDDHGNSRASASLIVAGSPLGGRLGSAGDVDYFKVAVGAGIVRVVAATDAAEESAPVLTIEVAGDDPAAEAPPGRTGDGVAWSDLPAPRPEHVYVKVSGNRALSYRLAVWLVAPPAIPVGDPFDIELRYPGAQPTNTQKLLFERAAEFWEGVITAGLPDLPAATSAWKCRDDDPSLFGEYLDDLLIYVRVEAVDGAAASTLCRRRSQADGGLPLLGSIAVDPDELATMEHLGFLERVAMRQIAYVLGFGLLWDEKGLLQDPSVGSGGEVVAMQDTHFSGTAASAAFDEVVLAYTGSEVPVENDTGAYGKGVLDLNWRESVFGEELMSTVMDTPAPPVSKVTIASLGDLGYEVNSSAAGTYSPPSGMLMMSRSGLQLGGHAVRTPAAAVAALPDGLVRAIRRQ